MEIKKIIPVLLVLLAGPVLAQENYEIQVYGSETMPAHTTIVELHSNFTFDGVPGQEGGPVSSQHAFHETLEITHGFNDWFETGFYLFTYLNNNQTSFVGTHIRPRVKAPSKWNLPVGLSLSIEGGYQKREFSDDDWSVEIRPIIDKTIRKLYLSFNPTLDKSFRGLNASSSPAFSPNFKISYAVTPLFAGGLEYYGSLGQYNHFEAIQLQQHLLFVAFDVCFSPAWEFNVGYGKGFTEATDNSVVKLILGYRF